MNLNHRSYRNFIAQEPGRAARELRGMTQMIKDEDKVRSEVIPFVISMLPLLFATKADAGKKVVRAVRNYNSRNNPYANEGNIDAIINGIPAIIRAAGFQNGIHAAAAMMDETTDEVQRRVARRFFARAPNLSASFPDTTQDMLDTIVDKITGGTSRYNLSEEFAQMNDSIHGRPYGQTWFIPTRNQQGNICDVLVLSNGHRGSIRAIRKGHPIWKASNLIHGMFRGGVEPAEVAKSISTSRRPFTVLDL